MSKFEFNPDGIAKLNEAIAAKIGETVTLEELFNGEFMKTNTRHASFEAMVQAAVDDRIRKKLAAG